MGKRCAEDHYWDNLVKDCINCQIICHPGPVYGKCASYCEAASCKALHGHYYDILLKKCVKCAEICGRHPAECSQHCQSPPTPMITVKPQTPPATTHVPISRRPVVLEDSAILIYSLLAMCIVLLFCSLSLALAVLLKRRKDKTSDQGRKKGANRRESGVAHSGQDVEMLSSQQGSSSKVFLTNCPNYREASDDATPTETCVCVHCFPDLKALGHSSDRPLREPYSFYQQTVLHRAQIQNGDPLWTEENLHNSGAEVRAEAAVG
ncbi:tumor necrosis factor receptor superfamily member 13B [Mugil cephalus]|uniref:tumor necrosis factor receptor superfamily member 13B n=1 Tax=Mugil cephalus TaxID=48193 RepID=UPI001FB65901|nr:tumor necrosis factor receptor superfamily member 13B [Mugil cephalus]XP_047464089.1 tumor necrosis factor receptor superfamily member 13B [Mugil cephalus]